MWKPYAPFERSLPSTVFVGYMNRFMETGKAESGKEIEFRSISDIQKTENEDWFRWRLEIAERKQELEELLDVL